MKTIELKKMRKCVKSDFYSANVGNMVICKDYREYVAEKSNNGGCYGYEDRFKYIGHGMWQHTEYTTGCGDICSYPEPVIVTTKRVIEVALSYLRTEDENLQVVFC